MFKAPFKMSLCKIKNEDTKKLESHFEEVIERCDMLILTIVMEGLYELPPRKEISRGPPLTRTQWRTYLTPEGKVNNFKEIRKIIFRGGVDPEIRYEVWPFLLDFYPPNSTEMERSMKYDERMNSYHRMKTQWETIDVDQFRRFTKLNNYRKRICEELDRISETVDFFKGGYHHESLEMLSNILMTHMMYNLDLGYITGMVDLLVPIVIQTEHEALAFWIFVKTFHRIMHFEQGHAHLDQLFKDTNLLLDVLEPNLSQHLIDVKATNFGFTVSSFSDWLKRELSSPAALILWESLLTQPPKIHNFHIFIALAILERHSANIMQIRNEFEICHYCNNLSLQDNLEEILCTAEGIYKQFLDVKHKLSPAMLTVLGLRSRKRITFQLSPLKTPRPEPVAGPSSGVNRSLLASSSKGLEFERDYLSSLKAIEFALDSSTSSKAMESIESLTAKAIKWTEEISKSIKTSESIEVQNFIQAEPGSGSDVSLSSKIQVDTDSETPSGAKVKKPLIVPITPLAGPIVKKKRSASSKLVALYERIIQQKSLPQVSEINKADVAPPKKVAKLPKGQTPQKLPNGTKLPEGHTTPHKEEPVAGPSGINI